jgi:hypothetical protein
MRSRSRACIASLVTAGVIIGCAVSRERLSAPDCGCGDPDGGCVDTELPKLGWRLSWAAQAGGNRDIDDFGPYELVRDLEPLPDGTVLASGRYNSEALFGAGEPNETVLPAFEDESDDDQNEFVARYGTGGELLWAAGFGGLGWASGARIARGSGDSSGSTGGSFLVLASYDIDMTIGLGQPTETYFTCDSFDDCEIYSAVLARFSNDGALEWATAAVDAGGSWAHCQEAALPDGSIAITGQLEGSIMLAPDTPEETIITPTDPSGHASAIARFEPDGSLAWAKRIGGPGLPAAYGVVRLLGGDLLVAGTFKQAIVLGEGEENETWLACGDGELDAGPDEDEWCPFLASYSDGGVLQWANSPAYSCSSSDLWPIAVAAPDGGFAIVGGFVGTGVLGQGEPNETVIGPTLEDDFDILVARYDSEGSLLWARQIVGETDSPGTMDAGTSFWISFLDSGELVLAGKYNGTPVFGPGEPNETTLPSVNGHRLFISLFYPNGNLAWAMDQDATNEMDWVGSVAAWGDSTFFVGGAFKGEATFGTSAEDQKTMTSYEASDIFVLRFDRTGE